MNKKATNEIIILSVFFKIREGVGLKFSISLSIIGVFIINV